MSNKSDSKGKTKRGRMALHHSPAKVFALGKPVTVQYMFIYNTKTQSSRYINRFTGEEIPPVVLGDDFGLDISG